ncbi:hypothetical protein PTKIN_Ptkin16aG0120000 [Pterospermum kingtungense]
MKLDEVLPVKSSNWTLMVEVQKCQVEKDGKEMHREPLPLFLKRELDDNGRRDVDYGNGGRQAWNNLIDSFSSKGFERNTREHYDNEQYNRYKGDAFQNSSLSKPSFLLGGKDPVLNFGREKPSLSKNEKPYLEDPFMKDFGATAFDGWDHFSRNLVGVVKRKKDTLKQTDFHDPERRKHAAKQKLLELKERIAKRQAEAAKGGSDFSTGAVEKNSGMTKERDVSKTTDVGDCEYSEMMVERITISASSGLSKHFDLTYRPHFSTASSAFADRGKPFNSRRRNAFENGNSLAFSASEQETENGHHSPKRDGSGLGRPFLRKEFYEKPSYMSSKPYHRVGVSEPHMDDFGKPKGQRWNASGDGDHYGRNAEIESEYHEGLAENYGDVTWGQSSLGSIYLPYPETFYQNPGGDGLYSIGRSRYSVRKPRVLPPPSLPSMQKTSYKGENEHPVPPTFLENQIQYNHVTRGGFVMERVYDSGHQEDIGQHGVIDAQPENAVNEVQKVNGNAARCDSQSFVSVSSPPDSPIHLSHDDLDESGDSTVLSAEEDKEVDLSRQGIKPLALPTETGKENEQEEYDEDEDKDGYQEEDEVHEGDDGNIDLTREFDEMHLEDKELPEMMDHLVLGFNEGVEVGMPNDEFEKSSMKEDSAYATTQISVGSL